jgi:hypothetical protein
LCASMRSSKHADRSYGESTGNQSSKQFLQVNLLLELSKSGKNQYGHMQGHDTLYARGA